MKVLLNKENNQVKSSLKLIRILLGYSMLDFHRHLRVTGMKSIGFNKYCDFESGKRELDGLELIVLVNHVNKEFKDKLNEKGYELVVDLEQAI